DSLKGSVVTVGAKVGTSGKLFGTVTTNQIADAINKQTGIKIDRKKITVEEDVKALGTYTAKIDLHKDVKVDISFEVVEE
ncbi:MAG TPA: 50S ribosomal L9 C-terminal domain-containing protein, partial [Flavobacterium sp.]|nr:50S ribosomal L9 C-terminal domain-containing protein [Flavobacterium sp.]